jgi:uncharacterized protein (DUF433 family)
MSELLARITIEADQNGGRPSIRGLRVRVQDVLELLSQGVSQDQILADFPYLEADDVRACLAYAAASVDRSSIIAA